MLNSEIKGKLMSQNTDYSASENDIDGLINEFISSFEYFSQNDKEKIVRAWNFLCQNTKGMVRSCGKPYYLHPLRICYILAQCGFDSDCIISGLLHSCQDFDVNLEQIEKLFGPDVKKIIDGTSRILNLSTKTQTLHQADAIRKMLFAMVDDVRVIFVKLADKLDRMRNIRNLEPQNQRILAQEAIDIWAPLADRLGMSTVKNELEDLSLKYTNPDAFQQIKAVISQKKEERAAYLEYAVSSIKKEAEKAGIPVTITSRAKHFYSIYQKMRKRNKEPGELFDLLALRIICQKNSECYTLIGIVHSLWTPLEGRFKDYIAMPKSNGYQSLHTTVMCKDKPLEIQIRTQKMHDIAEHGVASHWLYKKGMTHDLVDVKNLGIFNQLQELKTKSSIDSEVFNDLKNDLLEDKIVVFTPKGEVKQLPIGSTAIDFAYAIHSAIGEKIVGAKANGKIIPLSQELKNTEIIEIITNPQAHPTPNQLKLAKTSKARQKIHSYLMANDVDFAEQNKKEENPVENPQKRGHHKGSRGPKKDEQINPSVTGKIKIGNTTNFMITFAKCCNPKPGDAICGYVSKLRGITIHRADCYTYNKIPDLKNRSVDVSWEILDEN